MRMHAADVIGLGVVPKVKPKTQSSEPMASTNLRLRESVQRFGFQRHLGPTVARGIQGSVTN